MNIEIAKNGQLWNYLSVNQRIMASDGAFLVADSTNHKDQEPTDYSYLVFPFAKLYEGFLKDLFLDLSIIDERDYKSTHFRIGRALSENLVRRLGPRSAYGQLREKFGEGLAQDLWRAWKQGRNLVFHYFPHNYRMLTRDQAVSVIELLISAMDLAIQKTNARRKQ